MNGAANAAALRFARCYLEAWPQAEEVYDGAKKIFQDFFTLWEYADSDVSPIQARKEYAAEAPENPVAGQPDG